MVLTCFTGVCLWIKRMQTRPLSSSSSHQCSCCGDNAQPLLYISPSFKGHLTCFRKLMCVPCSSCGFASLLIYGSRLSVPSGVFIGTAVEGVSVRPWSTWCWNSSQFLGLQHFPWGPGGFVPEVSSLVPWCEFPWLNDILHLCFILTL